MQKRSGTPNANARDRHVGGRISETRSGSTSLSIILDVRHSGGMTKASGAVSEHPNVKTPARGVDRRQAAAAGLLVIAGLLVAAAIHGFLAPPASVPIAGGAPAPSTAGAATGTISGRAGSHPPWTSGPAVSGLTVEARNPSGQLVASAYASGLYGPPTYFMDLAPGDYTIGVQYCTGLRGRANVQVSSGSSTDVNIFCS
jgi:hypothetical protein